VPLLFLSSPAVSYGHVCFSGASSALAGGGRLIGREVVIAMKLRS